MIQFILDALNDWQRKVVIVASDFFIALLSLFLAFYLRLGVFFPLETSKQNFIATVSLLAIIQELCFLFLGFYRGMWRYSSVPDLIRIIKGVSLSILISLFVVFTFQRADFIPRSIFIIDWALLILGIGGSRFAYRIYRDSMQDSFQDEKNCKNRIIVIGAGGGGEQFIRQLKKDAHSESCIVGIVDDDCSKKKKLLHGIEVMGGIIDLPQVARDLKATCAVIAIPSATGVQLKKIISVCESTGLVVKTLPRLADLVSGKVQISKLRNVAIEDLLGRDEVTIDFEGIAGIIKNKTVLVTGAGGSIGSELCKQISKFEPKLLVCFDMGEFNLYELDQKLQNYQGAKKFVIGDVRDLEKVEAIFSKFSPEIVFHAAAYKHVPLMEENPFEAIKVNVKGTQNIVEACKRHAVERFVMISTDKAVNPTNVMGTSKRIAEMVCQYNQKESKTKFVVVRFGNVLGSSGSVIPLFKKQIEEGGPITVTHPEIRRFFMSIPEAARLVLQAGALGNGGEIFVLDMGEPVKIVDLAKQMITLSGYKVDEDIKIVFSGLRKGEKLYEELLADEETTLPSTHGKIRVAKVRNVGAEFPQELIKLFNVSKQEEIRQELKRIVSEYNYEASLD